MLGVRVDRAAGSITPHSTGTAGRRFRITDVMIRLLSGPSEGLVKAFLPQHLRIGQAEECTSSIIQFPAICALPRPQSSADSGFLPSSFIPPCHPTPAAKPPVGAGWVHEVKWDGYRAQAHLAAGRVIVYTRNGHDWTRQFAPIANALIKLRARSAILDGEAEV